MDIKKLIAMGMGVSAMAFFAACSSNSSEPENNEPENPELSSSSEEGTEPAPESSTESTVNGSSSSAGESAKTESSSSLSSSSVDESFTQMAITEIMYNAPDSSELEWIEVTVASGPEIKSMLASGVRLDGAVSFTFPNESLKKGEYVVVTNDTNAFNEMYPDLKGKIRLYGPWDKDPATGEVAKLSNEGDVIDVKILGDGDVSCSYSKDPPWPSLANGKGRTLVYKGGNAAQASSWGASKDKKGHPGSGDDKWLTTSNVRLNEIMPTLTGATSWVELYNAGKEAVDVSGWVFESKIREEKLTIASGVVPAGGYLVLDGATDFLKDGEAKELIVSPIGGAYYLYGATDGDESSLLLPSSKLSSGVVDLADGSTAQGAMKEATKGAKNSALYIGPVVINEIHYHPNEDDANDVEFLELKNTSTENITLFQRVEEGSGSRGWKVEGINMEFTKDDVLPAGGLAVLFPESLSTALGESILRKRFSIAEGVMIRFYKGKLSNRGETIAVKSPYAVLPSSSSPSIDQWYYDWSDATLYSDSWGGDYKKADGYGYSLQRKDYSTMSYNAAGWTVGKPTPGK